MCRREVTACASRLQDTDTACVPTVVNAPGHRYSSTATLPLIHSDPLRSPAPSCTRTASLSYTCSRAINFSNGTNLLSSSPSTSSLLPYLPLSPSYLCRTHELDRARAEQPFVQLPSLFHFDHSDHSVALSPQATTCSSFFKE